MKILYCIDHLRPDGTQRVLLQLVEGLAQRGHTQAVLCLNSSWDVTLVNRLRQAGAQVRIVGKVALVSGYGLWSAWHWLRRERFDVAVTLLFASDVLGRALAHVAGVPRIVSSLRARNANYAAWQRWLVSRTMRWVDAVVLNSAAVRDFAIIQEGAAPDRIDVIPNGVSLTDYAVPVDTSAVRAEFGLSLVQPVIGSVGRLTRQKGYDVLLQALALISRSDIQLVLIGSGEEEDNLRRLTVRLNLESRVHFLGHRQDVPRLLHILDVYVQPSRFEGMPNTLLEAMAAGCPIIASAVDGNCELIDSSLQGWLTPVENAAALAEAIQSALTNTIEAQRRASAARLRAATSFDVESMIAAWERALRNEA